MGPRKASERATALPRRLLDGNTISLGNPDTTTQQRVLEESDTGPFVFIFEAVPAADSTSVLDTSLEGGIDAAALPTRLPLNDPKMQVSRKHATLVHLPESNTFKITDHSSLNGVFVNRLKIAPNMSTPITVGSEVSTQRRPVLSNVVVRERAVCSLES